MEKKFVAAPARNGPHREFLARRAVRMHDGTILPKKQTGFFDRFQNGFKLALVRHG